jgi:transketolase
MRKNDCLKDGAQIKIDCLKEMSQNIRLRLLELTYGVGRSGAHIGGGLSVVELLTTLYGSILNFDKSNPNDINRDRFILSKGHSAIALYSVLEQVGFMSKEEVDQFEVNGSPYYAHASRNLSKGIEFSGGSLSLGLSFAVGVALSCKKDNLNNHIYVLVGDGECDEGLVWESLMSASHFNLANLTVIVDFNGCQSDGHTKEIMNKSTLGEKFKSFGFNVKEIDGHNLDLIYNAFVSRDHSKPNAIIAHTVKGKGVSFMENNPSWHHGYLSLEQYEQAKLEQK